MSLCTELNHCESFDKTQGLFISHQTVMTPTLQLFLDPIDRLIDVPFSPPLHDYLTMINATQDSDQKVYPKPGIIRCSDLPLYDHKLLAHQQYDITVVYNQRLQGLFVLFSPFSFPIHSSSPSLLSGINSLLAVVNFFLGAFVLGLAARFSVFWAGLPRWYTPCLVGPLAREPLSPVGVFPFPPPLRSLFSRSRASRRGCVWGRCSWVGRGRPA